MDFPPYAPFLAAGIGFFFLILAYRRILFKDTSETTVLAKAAKGAISVVTTVVYLLVGAILLILAVFMLNELYGFIGIGISVVILLIVAWIMYRVRTWKNRMKNWMNTQLRSPAKLEKSKPESWGLAAAGPLALINGQDYHTLGGIEVNAFNQKMARRKLDSEWEAPDEEAFHDLLDWLFDTGHRKEFEAFVERILALAPGAVDIFMDRLQAGEEGITDRQEIEEVAHRVTMILNNTGGVRDSGFLAWDLLRFLDLCRWGYLAGYQGEEETRQRLLAASQVLQSRYGSWEEMGANYLTGMEFWSVAETRREGAAVRKAFDKFLKDEKSPWRTLPWTMNLKN